MSGSRGPAEPYVRSFEATVTRITDTTITLDQTYFYPEGGGQPADRGTIAGIPVVDVTYTDNGHDDEIAHVLADDPRLEPGDEVTARIDDDFRTYCMRAHTASHVLYGAGRRVLDDIGYGGFGIDEEKARIDFETTTRIDDDVLVELERLANQVVWDSRPVTWQTHPPQDALDLPDIAFNTKTEEGIVGDAVRVVTIADWDVAACGGTHVENTREIGPITLLDRSNPGEGLTRVELTVGPPAIDRRTKEKQAMFRAAAALEVAPIDLPDAAERARSRADDLADQVDALTNDLVASRLDALEDDVVEIDGDRWLVGVVDGVDAKTLGEHAKARAGTTADVVALVGRDGQTVLAIATSTGTTDASTLVDGVTAEFGGGGGGSPSFAQAGGLGADPTDVVRYLRAN